MSHYAYLIKRLSSGRMIKLWTSKDALSEDEAKELFDIFVKDEDTCGYAKFGSNDQGPEQRNDGSKVRIGDYYDPKDAKAPWNDENG